MSYRSMICSPVCALLLCSVWSYEAVLASPQKTQPGSQGHTQTGINANESRNVDVCSLLTGTEITAVLGEPVGATKPSVQSAGNLKMSHCLFVTRNFAKSASLEVATPGSADSSARSLRAFWRNQFHSPLRREEERRTASRKGPAQSAFSSSPAAAASGPSDSESKNEAEAEVEAGKPRPIRGLGEEAYWVGSPLAGALYVLQGDLFIRISVGGIPKESARIAKSRSIANAVLQRLRR
jgi:hypothetical protein